MADIIFGSGISIGTGISVTPPPFTIPDAPTIGSATATGSTTATVAFTQPGNDGGLPITSYTATSSPGGITGTLSQAGSGTINMTGLSQGTSYTFTVTATNAIGTSSPSSASNSITTYTVPGAPTIGTATAIGSTTATVTFTAPVSDGGSTITSYTATSSPGSITGTLSQAGSGTITVDGLTPSTSYTFTVTATNSVGTGSASSASNSTTTTAPQDSYFEYNTLLIPGASTTFVDDASTNNFAVTINGDTKPNNFNPYTPGYYSNYFDGTGDYLTVPYNAAISLGSGDFTFDMWIYPTVATRSTLYLESGDRQGIFIDYNNGNNGISVFATATSGSWSIINGDPGNPGYGTSNTIKINTWTHFAFVRSGTNWSTYINGVRDLNITASGTVYEGNGTRYISYFPANGLYLNGYMSNFRLVKGTALYSGATLTVPTSPLTAVSGTGLLTCQSNRFIDNSTNNFTITVAGNTSINSVNPFTPNSSYSTYGSGYFDGTGDYLALPIASQATLTANSNFTFEAYVYLTGYSGTYNGIWGGSGGDIAFAYSSSNSWGLYPALTGSAPFMYSGMSVLNGMFNRWAHVALTRNGNSWNVWVDGVSVASATQTSTSIPNTTKSIGSEGAGANTMMGYISDARYTSSAVYTTTFTPPSAPLTAIANTQLLTLQNNQSVNNSVFLDNSTNNFFVTRAGNATQGTFSPYGANWSNYFDGSTSYLTTASSSASAGNFTMEAWIYRTAATQGVVIGYGSETTGRTFMYITSGGGLVVGIYNVGDTTFGGSIPINQWTHIAIVRSTNVITGYISGTAQATTTSSAVTIGNTGGFGVGAGKDGSTKFTGYISNARVVVGVAVYTSAFTPSTTPLTAISGTSLLTCQSNGFKDNSTNAYAITVSGSPTIQRFSPFNPSAEYSTSTIGGSAYFDGTGDNLSIANNANLAIGSGQFTVEMWIYFNNVTNLVEFFEFTNTGNSGCFTFWFNGTNTLQAVATGGAGVTSVTWSPTAGQWYHLAASRDASNNQRVFVNGVLLGTATSTNNYAQNGFRIFSTTHNGYIADARAIVGSCLYTTSFTPPTAPLTAVSGTILLLSNTTAGAYDAAMMTTMETVGDAKLSTAVSKFGGSSMSFDGTGDYLVPSAPNSNLNLVLGTGNFTIEFWVYFNSGLGSDIVLYDSRPLTTNGVYPTLYVNSSSQLSYVVSGTDQITSGSAFSATTWYHVALCRSSTSTKMFINGTQVGSTYTDSNNYLNPARRPVIAINGYNETAAPLNGYIDDLRVTKGVARYTSNFTAPTQAFPTY